MLNLESAASAFMEIDKDTFKQLLLKTKELHRDNSNKLLCLSLLKEFDDFEESMVFFGIMPMAYLHKANIYLHIDDFTNLNKYLNAAKKYVSILKKQADDNDLNESHEVIDNYENHIKSLQIALDEKAPQYQNSQNEIDLPNCDKYVFSLNQERVQKEVKIRTLMRLQCETRESILKSYGKDL